METKKLDLNAKEFTANGKKYFIETSLSIDRYTKYEEIEIELGFGIAFMEVFDIARAAMNDIDKQRQGQAYVKLYNLINGVQQMKFKKPHVFRFCALFINAEDEDRRYITEDTINKKIDDWRLEGLDYEAFFYFAINSLPGFRERYKKLTQAISNQEVKENQEKRKV